MLLSVTGAGLCLMFGFLGEKMALFPPALVLGFYALSYLLGGWDTARHAIPDLFRGELDTHLLMLAAAIGAAILGKWAEGAFLLFLFSLGHAGEHYALDRANHAVNALGELMPKMARVRREAHIEEVPVEALLVGDVVVVPAGSRVPADGEILAGESSLDQSAITGESTPVAREPGAAVFAGTVNLDNALDIRVSSLSSDNTLARVMRLVEEARENKSPAQQFAEGFTSRFVPIVLVLTLLVILLPPLLLHWTWADSFYRGMLVLVAASPCALAIGPPAAVLAGIAQAARHGVLIKGGVYLENLGQLKVMAFDKTGTLTTGKFAVTGILPLGGYSEADVLRVAAAVEELSNHPLAKAIVGEAASRGLALPSATDGENLAGRGVRAAVEGRIITVGALRAAPETIVSSLPREKVADFEERGWTTALVYDETRCMGIIGLADQLRPKAARVLLRLRELGVRQRILLTGDNEPTARAVARQAGIDDYHAALLPEQKLDVLDGLKTRYGAVAMVGDGVNDAPAIAAATVGIAMGGAGTAVALETADVALMNDDLTQLPFAVGLSRASRRIIQQNLVIALGVIVLLVIASLSGLIPLSVAVLFHEGSTVAVVFNALRLLVWKDS